MRSIPTAIPVLLALLMAGCARQQAGAEPVAKQPGPIGTWQLADAPAGKDGKRPWLEFREGGELGGNAGCNSFGATYALGEGGSVTMGPVRQTKMYCDEPRMQVEARMVGALGRTASLEISGDRLTLRDAAGAAVLELERATPSAD